MSKFESIFLQFSQALTALKDALVQPKNEYMRDSVIQRFEFTLDLAWKAAQTYLLEIHGI